MARIRARADELVQMYRLGDDALRSAPTDAVRRRVPTFLAMYAAADDLRRSRGSSFSPDAMAKALECDSETAVALFRWAKRAGLLVAMHDGKRHELDDVRVAKARRGLA